MEPSAEETRQELESPQPMVVDAPEGGVDPSVDLYAQAELERRHERMELMIEKARRLT